MYLYGIVDIINKTHINALLYSVFNTYIDFLQVNFIFASHILSIVTNIVYFIN